jgi:hypothetical protein
MIREVLLWCLPCVAMVIAALAVLRLLVWANNVRPDWRRLLILHGDQRGGVQSLSFVLTVPLFVIIVMFIVQVSQLMIARAVVEYSAFAAARCASVWIPANLGPHSGEMENQISSLTFLREELGSDGQTYSVYQVAPGSPKFNKVHYAAAMACLPICPSRDTGVARTHPGNAGLASLIRAYLAAAPSAASNGRVPNRLQNKLAYALANTNVRIEIWHKEEEVPLVVPFHYELLLWRAKNEIGWQDQIHVTVRHNFALLPGPGRLLARRTDVPSGSAPVANTETPSTSSGDSQGVQYQIAGGQSPPTTTPSRDRVADSIGRIGDTFVYTLTSRVRLNNEGERSIWTYVQSLTGAPASSYVPCPEPPESGQPCPDCQEDQNSSESAVEGPTAGDDDDLPGQSVVTEAGL